MKRIAAFFRSIYEACTHIPFYGTITKELYGASMRYFLALVTLLSIVAVVVISSWFARTLDTAVSEFSKSAPDFRFTIENGELSTSLPEPFIVLIDRTGTVETRERATAVPENVVPIIVDTTGAFTSLDAFPGGVLITKTGAHVKENYQTRDIDFSGIAHTSFSKQEALSLIDKFKGTIKGIGIAGITVGLWLWLFLSSLIYILIAAFVGWIFCKEKLRYGQVQQIGFYALTAPLLIDTIYAFFLPSVPYLFTGIFIIYFVLGLRTALDTASPKSRTS